MVNGRTLRFEKLGKEQGSLGKSGNEIFSAAPDSAKTDISPACNSAFSSTATREDAFPGIEMRFIHILRWFSDNTMSMLRFVLGLNYPDPENADFIKRLQIKAKEVKAKTSEFKGLKMPEFLSVCSSKHIGEYRTKQSAKELELTIMCRSAATCALTRHFNVDEATAHQHVFECSRKYSNILKLPMFQMSASTVARFTKALADSSDLIDNGEQSKGYKELYETCLAFFEIDYLELCVTLCMKLLKGPAQEYLLPLRPNLVMTDQELAQLADKFWDKYRMQMREMTCRASENLSSSEIAEYTSKLGPNFRIELIKLVDPDYEEEGSSKNELADSESNKVVFAGRMLDLRDFKHPDKLRGFLKRMGLLNSQPVHGSESEPEPEPEATPNPEPESERVFISLVDKMRSTMKEAKEDGAVGKKPRRVLKKERRDKLIFWWTTTSHGVGQMQDIGETELANELSTVAYELGAKIGMVNRLAKGSYEV